MKTQRLPWSWAALAVSTLPLGGVWTFGIFFTQMFRQGQDADMSLIMFSTPLHAYIGQTLAVGLLLAPLVALCVGLANLTPRPRRTFRWLTPSAPVLLLVVLGMSLWGGPMSYLSTFDYPPRWMELVTTAAAFAAAVWCYNRTVSVLAAPAAA
ncbi:hypothetical protein [Caulobacter mirabilis]|uniref:Uncharacterized protein n=1 Tax=Caulobacter mirabilis TaxID=69666 RepID=A0A2D2AXM3_9CAUL|nr:hypothetical protein [Caulobacter mirabilis]ATQ42764.1 hypothetical protein CSW64_10250 [Caulobacter mirabilis]